jgi:hypothetical protein
MSSATVTRTTRHGTRVKRFRRAALTGIALASIAIFASACSSTSQSPSVASTGGGSTPSASSSAGGSAMQKALAYASCMRSHGVPNFPDPASNGQFQITSNEGVNINSPQYQNASKDCQSLAPALGGSPGQNRTAALRFSSCMRSHGVPNFPDPNANGGFMIGANNGIDPNSPQYQNAQRACQKYMPGAASGGGTFVSGGGQ